MRADCWVIQVGGGYGAFLHRGDEASAEEMRVHKARWERAIARKRPATDEEAESGKASQCWNHPGYAAKTYYADCQCPDENCVANAEERLEARA